MKTRIGLFLLFAIGQLSFSALAVVKNSTTAKSELILSEKTPKTFVVAFPSSIINNNFTQTLPKFKRILLTHKNVTLLEIEENSEDKFYSLMESYKGRPETIWVHPVLNYEGDPREDYSYLDAPNDPNFKDQSFHKVIQSELAWDIEKGNSNVIIAVPDNGFSEDHEDLKTSLWTNEKEIPNNGIDDDQNGFIDDVHGWSFVDNSNEISSSQSHGVHIQGIIAATQNNNKGGSGVGPELKVMPIKFVGKGRGYNATIFLEAYKYAVDNGAKIITTSYNIDQFKNNPIFLSAIDYAYDNGVLLFNSGGNNNYENPRRVSFEKLILVVATHSEKKGRYKTDQKARFSNYGSGMDIAAPGFDIFSTVRKKYKKMSGTSMASPMAAAAAGLIWSKYPEFTKEQVINKLLSSSEDINTQQSSKHKNKVSTGRINLYSALTKEANSPKLGQLTIVKKSKKSTDRRHQIKISLPDRVKLSSKAKNGFLWQQPGKDKKWDTEDDIKQYIQPIREIFLGSNFIDFGEKTLNPGKYRIIVKSQALQNYFGDFLDGTKSGKSGGDFISEVTIP